MSSEGPGRGYAEFGDWLRDPSSVLRFAETRRVYRAAARDMYGRLAILGVLGLGLAIASILPAVTLKPLVEHTGSVEFVDVAPFLATIAFVGLLEAVQQYLIGTVVAGGTRRLSLRAFTALLRSPAEWFGVLPLGSSVKVTAEDAPAAAYGLAQVYQLVFASARVLAVLAGLVVLLPIGVGAVAGAVVAAGMLVALRLQGVVLSFQRQTYVASLELAEYIGERCQDITLAEVRIARTQAHEVAGLARRLDQLAQMIVAVQRWSAGRVAAVYAAAACSALVVAVIAMGDDGSAGTIVVGLVLSLALIQVAPAWFDAREQLIGSATAMTRVLALERGLAGDVGTSDGASGGEVPFPQRAAPRSADMAPEGGPAAVQLRDVAFTYPSTSSLPAFLRFNKVGADDVRSQVLYDVSFDVEPGQMVALVGHSGAGKSTIARLIAGLYAPTSGEVTIDGHPAAAPEGSAPAVALVPDRPWLIDSSIVDNVRYGSATATLDEVHWACRRASVLEFAQGLPAGLNTPVGVNGSKLSAGERQRLALARALLRRPRVLLLDEVTAMLDADSEAAIRRTVVEELSTITRIVIAHRMSTVQDAALIFVVSAGSIIDYGTHDELRNESELYARWVSLQAVQGTP